MDDHKGRGVKKVLLIVVLVPLFGVLALVGLTGGDDTPALATQIWATTPSAEAQSDIPPAALTTYRAAAEHYRIDWTTIAGIGKVLCDHGRSTAPGCAAGTITPTGQRGPMLFTGSRWRTGKTDTAPTLDLVGPATATDAEGLATDGNADNVADPTVLADAAWAVARALAANHADTNPTGAVSAVVVAAPTAATAMEWAHRYDGGPALANLAAYQPVGGWALPATSGRISYFGDASECQGMALYQNLGGRASCSMIADPTLKWFIAMRWPAPGSSYGFWRTQRILITNRRTGKMVVTIAGDWGPAAWTGRVVDVSEPVMEALGASTDDMVDIRFVAPTTPAGPVTGAAPATVAPAAGSGTAGLSTIDWDGQPGGATFTIASSIALKTAYMAQAAHQAGLPIGGWGWRSGQRQIELRRQNCGTSQYAIYEMPSGSCSPPTAKPGASKHEQGLAIDFTCNGETLHDGDPCHEWLVRHAARFGFFPFGMDYYGAREPWHWSVNGH